MGQLGHPSNLWPFTKGLPLENETPGCPDTSLQYHSRHWVTSFRIGYRYR
jgi:hypothetical protein